MGRSKPKRFTRRQNKQGKATSWARWTSSRTNRRSWRLSATPLSPNFTSKVEHQEAPCPTECPTEYLVGCRKDQPALDQTLVQQSKKSTRSMLLFNSSLLRNFISVIEHKKHVIFLPKYFDRNIYMFRM